MIDLSIIIPLYNAADFIERCVTSCADQGLGDHCEIIVVDDGSTDNSLAVAEALRDKYPTLRVFSQENQGAGIARNHGLSEARGRYVSFVDSDDYLLPNSIKAVLDTCKTHHLDLCKYAMILKDGSTGAYYDFRHPVETMTVFSGEALLANPQVSMDSACASVYNKAFLESHSLRFPDQTSSEDSAFCIMVYSKAKRIMFTDTPVYVYEFRQGTRNSTYTIENRRLYMLNNIANASLMKKMSSESDFSPAAASAISQRVNSMMFSVLYEAFSLRSTINKTIVRDLLQSATDKGLYPIKGKTFAWKSTLMAKVFNNKHLFLALFKC